MDFEKDAYRYAVKNAFEHGGKADTGAVIGKVIALHKGVDIKKAMLKVMEIAEKVNALSQAELDAEYRKFEEAGFELKPQEKKAGLPELDWAEKGEKVVTRYAPNPNGPFHLGNARAALLSHEYARKYRGKFILRFDDTDPKVKRPIENAEQIFREDLEWLGCNVDETYFASDRLGTYHDFMRKLIELGGAYVCLCNSEKWKDKAIKSEACDCRKLGSKEHLARFEKMLNNVLKEGQAVLRIKTDLMHKDPSIRDWWAAKIVDAPNHPRVGSKNHVWPSYNFASAIDDHELGVTLIIRGQEHTQNSDKQKFLYGYFNWVYPHAIHFGRVALGKMVLSTSLIKKGIESGKYTGWDDPRLGTIKALRRRGFDAGALRKVIIDELGIKSSGTTIELDKLADLNKEFIDKESERIAFIEEPIRLDVVKCPETTVARYEREYSLGEGSQTFFVEKKEIMKFKVGDIIRLRDAYNVRITRIDEMQVFAEFTGTTKTDKNIVPWITNDADVEITMANAGKKYGICPEFVRDKKPNDHLYLERLGYHRVDSASGKRVALWFTHK